MAIGNDARIAISSGDELDVRSFSVEQGMSQLFSVEVLAVSRNHDIDFDSVIGNDARFELSRRSHADLSYFGAKRRH